MQASKPQFGRRGAAAPGRAETAHPSGRAATAKVAAAPEDPRFSYASLQAEANAEYAAVDKAAGPLSRERGFPQGGAPKSREESVNRRGNMLIAVCQSIFRTTRIAYNLFYLAALLAIGGVIASNSGGFGQ